MSASTVPAVRAALVARVANLLAAGGDTETKATYGHPGQKTPARFVAVSTTENGVTREQRTMPLRQTSSKTETYDLRLVFWNLEGKHDTKTQQRVTEQCWAAFDLVDTGLRAEPTLDQLVTAAQITRAVDDDFLLTEGRAAQIVATVTITVNRA
jgi:hypothetical protein